MPHSTFGRWGFESFSEYTSSLRAVYRNLATRALSPVTPLEEVQKTGLPRKLNFVHVRWGCLLFGGGEGVSLRRS